MDWNKASAIATIVGLCIAVPALVIADIQLIIAQKSLSSQLDQIQRDLNRQRIQHVTLQNTNDSIRHDYMLNNSTWSSFTFYAFVTLYYSGSNFSYLISPNLAPQVKVTSYGILFDFYNMTGRWAMIVAGNETQARFVLQVHYSQTPILLFIFDCQPCKDTGHFLLQISTFRQTHY
jgi:hypothetical protein